MALFSGLPLPVQSFRLYLPPGRRVPLFLSQSRLAQAACHPRPLPCWLPVVSRPTRLAVLGNSSRFLEKTTGAERKALSLPGPRPSPGPGGRRPEAGSPAVSGFSPAASGSGPRRPPPPPSGQQPKYYSAGGVGGGGRRPGLKEAFRVAKPGASCPQARASGCPTGDLRWPERRGVVVGSLGEGGAICRGFWWPPARLASPGVGRCDPPPHPRDSRLVSNVEKYHHQTWDVWTDRRMR